MSRGKLITLEGGEGAGKSTQQKALVQRLAQRGIEVLSTREPGGAKGADEIRKLLLTGAPDRWDAMSEALLMVAARRCHLVESMLPALAAGKWVVCDRFADSTFAYQGYGGGVSLDQLAALHRMIAGDLEPDLTILLDVPVEIGLARAARRQGQEKRFESKEREFHERVRRGFLEIAKAAPGRCVVLDATADAQHVQSAISDAVRTRLGLAALPS